MALDTLIHRQSANQSPGIEREQPTISVVVASVNGPTYLEALLTSLDAQVKERPTEVIIADCCGTAVAEVIQRHKVKVKLMSFSERKSIPELRALALKTAAEDIVAVTEDHCMPDPHWSGNLIEAHKRQYGVIGGAVENHRECKSVVDWAAYFCEYSEFMNPFEPGEAKTLAGNNLSYRREFLKHVSDLLAAGCFWEDALVARMRERGIRCFRDPSIVVHHKKSFKFPYFLSQRYHYARAYAGIRMRNAGLARKLVFSACCVFLPPMLFLRIGARILRKRRHLMRFLAVQPLLWIFLTSWAVGEFVGYLWGAGTSLLKVE
jgi:glycosyltransferase involved in cell wall biosynthesis